MVDVAGLVDMASKYGRHSRQCRHSVAWHFGTTKTLTILCLLEQPVFYFVYIAFIIK